jgi:hypothetical protein
MNVEIGAEAAQFPEKEYINEMAVAVRRKTFALQVEFVLAEVSALYQPMSSLLYSTEELTRESKMNF